MVLQTLARNVERETTTKSQGHRTSVLAPAGTTWGARLAVDAAMASGGVLGTLSVCTCMLVTGPWCVGVLFYRDSYALKMVPILFNTVMLCRHALLYIPSVGDGTPKKV